MPYLSSCFTVELHVLDAGTGHQLHADAPHHEGGVHRDLLLCLGQHPMHPQAVGRQREGGRLMQVDYVRIRTHTL